MDTEYEIIIKKRVPYMVKKTAYEGTDGKRYYSTYGIPEGVEYKEITYETGEISHNEKEVYSQKQVDLDLTAVIKAVNKL